MDQKQLKKYAQEFDQVVSKYAIVDSEAAVLQRAMSRFVQEAIEGKITAPIESRRLPGFRIFEESNLRKYKDLELALAKFQLEITGFRSLLSD